MSDPGMCGGRVDRYEVQSLLGIGGMGAVYRARHTRTGAPIALKVLKKQLASTEMLDRFMQEARAAAAVGSEHIVRVVDADLSRSGIAFIAMEFLDGLDLKQLAARDGRLHPARVVGLIRQVLDGLSAAHAKGVVHRDMKPANVLVSELAGVELAKVLDFGISRMHDSDARKLTRAGAIMGTPGYMAYEQLVDARDVDARTDLYAVSVMLYELLSGKKPYDSTDVLELIPLFHTRPIAPLRRVAPRLPAPLCAVVDKGLERQRERRWQSAVEMRAALKGVLPLLGTATVVRGRKGAVDAEANVATRSGDDVTQTD